MRRVRLSTAIPLLVAAVAVVAGGRRAAAQEPQPIHPFGPRRSVPTEARPGVVRLSDGNALYGQLYLTPGKRWRFYDEKLKRYIELPLRVIERVEVTVAREWLEKEWRFREAASNEKVYTGRKYPARVLHYKITLINGRQLEGRGSTVLYAKVPGARRARKLILRERQKGKPGQTLKQLVYVREIDFRAEAVERFRQQQQQRQRATQSDHDVNPRK